MVWSKAQFRGAAPVEIDVDRLAERLEHLGESELYLVELPSVTRGAAGPVNRPSCNGRIQQAGVVGDRSVKIDLESGR